ncbi:sensor histidine kinase [Nannocystis radixulma]|uniref:Histidine kinase n=1 Tax=Nannocystis radixulma TaxID=2995305 RepID=A0ABT5BDM2_9BACT|nr:histidine kinase [Nannocystis radixulma]MDC0672245.1 histidine kinase [Nannocystis radixulma]
MRVTSLLLLRLVVTIGWAVAAGETLADAASKWPPRSGAVLAGQMLLLLACLPALLWLIGGRLRGARSAVALLLLAVVSLAGALLYPDLLYLVAATLPFIMPRLRALAWLAAANVVCVPWLLHVLAQDGHVSAGLDVGPPWLMVSSHVAWQVVAFGIGVLATLERDQRAEAERLNGELVATQSLLADSARLASRREVSRELHDTLGHHLTVLHLQLELALRLTDGHARATLEEARVLAKLLLADVREVAGELRSGGVIDLRAALVTLAAGVRGPRVEVRFDDGFEITDPERAHAVFRCAQEAITNAIRHAGAGHVWIDVGRESAGVVLSVRDDGRVRLPIRAGHGLSGMRERIEALGGRLELGRDVRGSLFLRACLPPAEVP